MGGLKILIHLADVALEGLLVILANGDKIRVVEVDAATHVAADRLQIDDVGAVYAHETICGQLGLHVFDAVEGGDLLPVGQVDADILRKFGKKRLTI